MYIYIYIYKFRKLSDLTEFRTQNLADLPMIYLYQYFRGLPTIAAQLGGPGSTWRTWVHLAIAFNLAMAFHLAGQIHPCMHACILALFQLATQIHLG